MSPELLALDMAVRAFFILIIPKASIYRESISVMVDLTGLFWNQVNAQFIKWYMYFNRTPDDQFLLAV
jgi:hypothetical protein